MDHRQWHPSTICPMCSLPHFPFCPPYPPPYAQPSRFPPPPPPPPLQPQPPPPPPPDYPRSDPYHTPLDAPPYANYSWHPNPNLDAFSQPPFHDYNNVATSGSNGYVGEPDRMRYKRPRVDKFGSAAFGHETDSSYCLAPSDNERRLKLIRDHGACVTSTPNYHDSTNSTNDVNPFQPNSVNQINHQNQHHVPRNGSAWAPPAPPPQYASDYQQQYGMLNYARHDYGGATAHQHNMGLGVQHPHLPPPPPLPVSPPPLPPPPMEPPPPMRPMHHPSPPNTKSFTLFPVPISSSTTATYPMDERCFVPKHLSPEKPTVFEASHLFKQPYRTTRPDHIVIILRGLPGSGKSYLAKMMRELEVENGGVAPRIHSMDDYFMTEVEKVEESETSKSSSLSRGKKPTVKKVMEYCYEPEMEESYRESMLKAFKKTIEEGSFTFVIVDDRNLRVADFAQFWAIAKRSGYEVYISEPTYKDPVGCAARNVHGFTLDEIQKMAGVWEETPLLYLRLDTKSLFQGDDLKKSGIQEVDMDAEDGDSSNGPSGLQDGDPEKTAFPPVDDDTPHVPSKDGKRWDAEEGHMMGVKELGKSKWSDDVDEDGAEASGALKRNNALSGLIQAYAKKRKSVSWSDQAGYTGFSISAAKKANTPSLVIGAGSGYNLKANPLPEDEIPVLLSQNLGKRQNMFQDQLRVERESFRAVFDRRKHRISRFDLDNE